MKFLSITPENNNASQFIPLTNAMPSFVKLYSPNCGHCVAMQKSWNNLKHNPELKKYNMAVIEVHANELDKINSPAMSVNGGFPTIRKVLKNGKLGKDYNGDRSTKDMVKFIQDEFKETLTKGKSMKGGKRIRSTNMRIRSTKKRMRSTKKRMRSTKRITRNLR
jgi:hypothetical protein